jgi:hypothetical protein
MKCVNAINHEGQEVSQRSRSAARFRVEVMRVIGILVATLREIFDEAAYARFLGREGQVSRESYAAFLREREAKTARRARCC